MSAAPPEPPRESAFPPTRWTLIRSVQASPEARREALRTLLGAYWRPLYLFVRHKGLAPDAARDAVQDLMVQLLERDFLPRLSPERGRLRSYLMAAATHALANRHETASAQKRGGGAVSVPLDTALAERLVVEDAVDPDEAFTREWALSVMERAMAQLQQEFAQGLRQGPFTLVQQFFRPGEAPSYRDAAAAHGMSVPQLKAFLHRARGRFRELVRAEVLETVEDPAQADLELAELQRVLSR
jgi:DNA-directed RNA polymerase specialized sigma24 family protein